MCLYPLKVFYWTPYTVYPVCYVSFHYLLGFLVFFFLLSKQVQPGVTAHCFEMFWASGATVLFLKFDII